MKITAVNFMFIKIVFLTLTYIYFEDKHEPCRQQKEKFEALHVFKLQPYKRI